jgi:hypothetical protein
MEFESPAQRSKSMGLTADDPATAAPGIDYVRRAGELAPELAVCLAPHPIA